MNLSNRERLAKLIRNFVANPRFIIPYLRHNVLLRRPPLELKLPWWSYEAIEFMERYVTKEMKVFEWGTGGSTLFFARRSAHVTSIEDDEQWLAKVRTNLQKDAITNVETVFAPFDFHHPLSFETSHYLRSLSRTDYDIIVIDGQDWTFTSRLACFRHAERHVRPGAIIIIDDSWRYTQLRNSDAVKSVRVMQSTGPSRYGVTSTDIYFY